MQPSQRRALFKLMPQFGCPTEPREQRLAWINGWRVAFGRKPVESMNDITDKEAAHMQHVFTKRLIDEELNNDKGN